MSLRDKARDYLKTKDYLNLATVSPEGRPMAHTVAYAADEFVVYFMTSAESRKMQHIMENQYVAYTVDDDSKDWSKMRGIQMQAKACVVDDPGEMEKARSLLIEKFPAIKNMPTSEDDIFVRLTPIECDYLDYGLAFGHTDTIKFP